MRADVLAHAMGNALTDARYAELAPGFSRAMADAQCTTVERAAMWCAQLGHESGGLRWMEELASGEAYEGRASLGNTQPGDGVRYKGRGPIQVTGRANYASCSTWAHARGLVPTRTFFVDNPTALASPQYGFVGAVWYWIAARPDINALSDARNISGVTRRINGGTNGLAERTARWQRCLAIGDALLDGAPAPNTSTPGGDWFDMATKDELAQVLRDVVGTPAQRADIGWFRDQLAAVLRFDPTALPAELAADPGAGDLARKADVGYLVQQLGASGDVAKGEGAPAQIDIDTLADAVADRLFARVVAHGGLSTS